MEYSTRKSSPSGRPQRPNPQWPGAVCPPNTPGFLQSAKAWLFDLAPARWHYEELLHRHPVELARLVRLRLEADIMAMRAALLPHPSPSAGDAEILEIMEIYRHEREWATGMREQVRQVETALGETCGRARGKTAKTMATRHTTLPSPRPASG
ncbi:hypothetical protein QFZ82_007999 [Streptomyces sp. V4I23]|uniref:hypothetical protein n=1 Tax=Streptomyces sp. V4I23 TaxID=3042282 RepID=UPI0027827E98|nr:hypothetical protein [Streptomyces sp. V4I23]MDQ1013431.1 hypothetical protein [Streptomyces sp. V4I23]